MYQIGSKQFLTGPPHELDESLIAIYTQRDHSNLELNSKDKDLDVLPGIKLGKNRSFANQEKKQLCLTDKSGGDPTSPPGINLNSSQNSIIPIFHSEEKVTLRTFSAKTTNHLNEQTKNTQLVSSKSNEKKYHNHDLADLLMQEFEFAVIENNLTYWDRELGYFVGLVGDEADMFIRKKIPDKLKRLVSIKSSEEILRWLKAKDQLQVSDEQLARRKEYVAFRNCIVKIMDHSIHRHKPSFYFTSVVNTDYPTQSVPSGDNFEFFIQQITSGKQALYYRIQELFGYILSEIRDVKAILFLLGPKDSGKSIVLKLLEHLVGEEFCTNLSLGDLNQPSYLCHLYGKKLNTCGETSEVALNKLDTLKKLSGGDYVMARFLYGQAFKFKNRSALLFAGNHLPTLKGISDHSNAFSQRLIIFPFFNQITKNKQDIHLLDKLLRESSYIVHWALTGLKRWCRNNHQFTSCKEIQEIEQTYYQQNNSVENFVAQCCNFDITQRIHNSVLTSSYHDFCHHKGIPPESDKFFHKHLQQTFGLRHGRFRIGKNNENGYYGIALKS
ncbi:DNA primase family protein [Priestia koreensis]|uniref:DNA primase family protein n=1 Tax=Priestia koreensis TaxID=284581 RepID=UPI003458FABE